MGSVAAFVPIHDQWIGLALAVCVVLLLLALPVELRGLKMKVLALLAPAGSRLAQEMAMTQVPALERWVTVLLLLLQSVVMGMLHMSLTALDRPVFCGVYLQQWEVAVTPVMLLGVETLLCLSMIVVRWLVYQWVHATFFGHDARMRWRAGYRLATAAEAMLLTVSVCLSGNADVSAYWAVNYTILSVFLTKIGLLWCAWHVFFGRTRAILHFFAYLCSAELIPLAVLWLSLSYVAGLLTA